MTNDRQNVRPQSMARLRNYSPPFHAAHIMSVLLCAVMLCIVSAAPADVFDWRDVDGQDWMSPVCNQGTASTCWAFSAVGALEAKVNITSGQADWDPDLSEQHLTSDGTTGSIRGGWEFKALNFFVSPGIVMESQLPYCGKSPSPDWPLDEGWEDSVFKVTAVSLWLPPSNATIKTYLQTYGPLVSAVDSINDWYWPETPLGVGGSSDGTVSRGSPEAPLGYGDDPLGSVDHAAVIAGFVDDPAVPEGGYWIIKNSWGTGWGDAGYGYIKYGVLESNSRIHAITGDAIWPVFDIGDVNRDGVIDSRDIDRLFAHLTGSGVPADALYDLDGDGDADRDDVSMLVCDILASEYGDLDLNGIVDAVDLTIVGANLGRAGLNWKNGDVNGDGVIDTVDLTILATNYGFGGSNPDVPEPVSLGLLASTGLIMLKRRR